MVYNHKVDIANDTVALQAKVKFSSTGGHVGVGFISVEGTARKGYQLLTAQNIKNVGCTEGGSGQGFDSKVEGFAWTTNKDYIFNVSISNGKISYIVYDTDGTTELAVKKDTVIYHGANDIVYPAFGGTQASNFTYSDISVTVNGTKKTIDGIDAQGQLPTLSLDKNVIRIKSTETGTIKATATYNGTSAKVTAVSADESAVRVSAANDGTITVTPKKATPGVTVTVTNASATYITASFTVVVADYPTANAYTLNVYPAVGATSAYTDGALRLTFDAEPTLNSASFVAIFDSDGELVDTITMSDEKQATNAGNTIKVKSQLVRVVGNDVLITPHFGVLANEKTYYVAIPQNAITGKIGGVDFDGLSNDKGAVNAWKFTTRAAHAAAATMTVSSDESATPDFRTIYGALSAIGTSSTDSFTINVAAGEYYELVNAKIAGTVKIVGPATAEANGTDTTKNAVIKYINHNDWNGGTAIRPSFYVGGTGNLVLENLTIWNATRRGVDTTAQEAQAEAIYFQSTGTFAAYNSTFKSYQDTVQLGNKGGKGWFYKCYIEGDVDFLWGTADVALFEECKLVALNDSARATKSEDLLVARTYLTSNKIAKGFVVFNSQIEVADGITLAFGRCAGSGDGFYDQCAVVNTKVTGTLSDAWWTAKNYTPLKDHEINVGWKDYNITNASDAVITPSARCSNTAAITDAVYNLEFNGRNTILNRIYDSTTSAYIDASSKWDVSALETEFSATADASLNNNYGAAVDKTTLDYSWTDADAIAADVNIQNKAEAWDDLYIDATTGKFAAKGRDSWIQCNTGTKIYVPVKTDAVITITTYSANVSATVGESATAISSGDDKILKYSFKIADAVTVTGKDGKYALITFGANDYIGAITRTVVNDKTWTDANAIAAEVNIQSKTDTWDDLYIDATTGKFAAKGRDSWIQCNSGTKIYVPVKTDAVITITTYSANVSATVGESATAISSGDDKILKYSFKIADAVTVTGKDGKYALITFGANDYIGTIKLTY
ncbi:hypothetical protein [uncultured Treponema sp.]|uniref:hypothetical protein n=1 Tax=uncultured Treponema sp. TaxID=162155 RepID=UPI0025F530A2|nr:hypothetical protein [uncultured Treponema sp.]